VSGVCRAIPYALRDLLLDVYYHQHLYASERWRDLRDVACEYVRWGVRRQLRGETPWPVEETRRPPKVPEFEALRVFYAYGIKNRRVENIARMVAAQLDVDERTFNSALKRNVQLVFEVDKRIAVFFITAFILFPEIQEAVNSRISDPEKARALSDMLGDILLDYVPNMGARIGST
jgi:hypothetical protein